MKLEELLKLGLDEETAKKVEAASTEELKGFIPKARFDEVNTEKKNLETVKTTLEGQLETLKNSTGTVEAMKQQIAELQTANKTAADEHAAEIRKIKINAAVDAALLSAKAKNSVAVRALLKDLDKADLQDDGTIKGLSEQIASLQKSDAYLFESKETKPAQMKGAKPGETGTEDPDSSVDISKMSYEEIAAYMEANPDAKI